MLAALTVFLCPAATLAEPTSTSSLLPVWREIFSRPDTSFTAIPAPKNNPLIPAKVDLGRKLFFDARLSGGNNRSCATCHKPYRAFTDGRRRAAALDGKTRLANTPPLLNLAWASRFFWDGRATSLEEQARHPIGHPQEMAGSWPRITARLTADTRLLAEFRDAFPETPAPSPDTVAAALASYERSLVSARSRFDRFIAGDNDALSLEETAGFRLFVGKAGCVGCHNGWRLTDDRLHRTDSSPKPQKTPTLRGLARTAPYMHDGAIGTLDGVIEHYTDLSTADPTLSPNLVRPLALSVADKRALRAFLRAID